MGLFLYRLFLDVACVKGLGLLDIQASVYKRQDGWNVIKYSQRQLERTHLLVLYFGTTIVIKNKITKQHYINVTAIV